MKVAAASNRNARPGLTLLEVLIAAGILVVGLASAAALLPAAVSVLADANAADRGGALAANAAADLQFRGALKASDFSATVKVVVTGTLPNPPFLATAPFKRIPANPTAADQQAYGTAWYGAIATPVASGTSLPRSGEAVRVTSVAFRRSDVESKQLTLTPLAGAAGVYRLTGGTAEQRDADRKRFLPPCSWAVAVSGSTVRWLHVGNSWTSYSKAGTTLAQKTVADCFVSFSDPTVASAAVTSGTLTLHGLRGVARIEERIVRLQ